MTRLVTTPHMGSYYVAARPIGSLFGDDFLMPPMITNRTLEIGTKYSPEAACIPFKYTLGNFIEALEQGANVLVQIGGGCRMGFYGEVQKVILRRLGYEFEFYKLTNDHNIFQVMRNIKQMKPSLSYFAIARTFRIAYQKAWAIDTVEELIRRNVGFEVEAGSFENLYRQFLVALDNASTLSEIHDLRRQYLTQFSEIQIDKPVKPLQVGVVGEIYVVMEPFSNFFLEKELARYGIEVHRRLDVTHTVQHSLNYEKHIAHLMQDAQPYIQHHLGAHGTESVSVAHQLAKQGFDGLIHVKPFGCMPEINAMPALQHISRDYKFPIIYFSFDALTSETGIKTRLEAFYDMLSMRSESWKAQSQPH